MLLIYTRLIAKTGPDHVEITLGICPQHVSKVHATEKLAHLEEVLKIFHETVGVECRYSNSLLICLGAGHLASQLS